MTNCRSRRALRTQLLTAVAGIAIASLPFAARADDAKETKADDSTAEAKSGPFRIEVELKGTLQPERVATIRVQPEEWSTLEVAKLAEQGAMVEKGDVILEFETGDLDEQIRQLEFTVGLAELTLEQTEKELTLLEETAPLDLELAERTKAEADEELAYFDEIDKALQIEQAKRSVESSEFQLEYATEELDQLRKMYEADDLTEETEEIILKRTERSVESAEYYLKLAKIRSKRLLETELPKRETAVNEAATRADISLRRTKVTVPLAVDRKKIELQKQRWELERSREKLDALKADRDLLVVRSPVAGVVYHGVWDDGAWSIPATIKSQLKVGGKLPARQPLMTVLRPQPLSVRTTVEEKDVALLEVGLAGTAKPTAFPDAELPCKVAAVAPFPVEPGKFAAEFDVDTAELERLVPGMTCQVTILVYEAEDAITVPAKAVFDMGGRQVVYVVDGAGDAQVRAVRTGRTHGGRTEILAGLEAGDSVRTTKP